MKEKIPEYQYKILKDKIGKLSGVKKELKAMKDKIEKLQIDITILKKDNTILRKLSEDLKDKFIKRRRWEYLSQNINKKMEEVKDERKDNRSTDEH